MCTISDSNNLLISDEQTVLILTHGDTQYGHVTVNPYLCPGQSVETLLQEGILSIPESEGETEMGLGIHEPQQSVLSPAVGVGHRVRVAEGLEAAAGTVSVIVCTTQCLYTQCTTLYTSVYIAYTDGSFSRSHQKSVLCDT